MEKIFYYPHGIYVCKYIPNSSIKAEGNFDFKTCLKYGKTSGKNGVDLLSNAGLIECLKKENGKQNIVDLDSKVNEIFRKDISEMNFNQFKNLFDKIS